MAAQRAGGMPRNKYNLAPIHPYLKNITIYETRARWYIIASDAPKQKYHVLKIDRTLQTDLNVVEDPVVYSFGEIQDLLTMIGDANWEYGGIKKVGTACALIGFVRFLKGYYMLFVTKKKRVGIIGKHKVYAIETTQDFYVPHAAYADKRRENGPAGAAASNNNNNAALDADEDRYRSLFLRFDLTKDFYFSYTYDLSNNLQYNMTRTYERPIFPPYNEMFVWNHYLMEPLHNSMKTPDYNQWLCPIIHGSFIQHKADVFGKIIQLTVVARRSRLFAGARFLKRGINEQGNCANDVETEQIVCEPNMGALSDSRFTSFVQHRGSIPLYWAQLNGGVMPKPPIIIQRVDPFHNATILHFMDLFQRYGSPIIVLNLVRSKEKSPREMILREAFGQAIEFINSSIDDEKHKIIYMAWDFKKAAKHNKSKLQRDMMAIAQLAASRIGFFHSGTQLTRNQLNDAKQATVENLDQATLGGQDYPADDKTGRLQTGVVRTNCIDSIDRTNAAQYMLGLYILGHQLYEMGLISAPHSLTFDSGISLLLMDMYEMIGHQLALQYGGSGLAHTMNTFNSKSIVDTSKDFWTTVQRYYSNTFTDQEKQNSMNMFLGSFKAYENETRLWALETDYFLHMKDYCRELLYIHRWWEEPLAMFRGQVPHRYLSYTLRNNLSAPKAPRPDITFDDHYSTFKLSEFDKMLSAGYTSIKKIAICKRPKKPVSAATGQHVPAASAPPSPSMGSGPAISAGLGGIMRWLWSPRSDSKTFEEHTGHRQIQVQQPDYSASNRNPLAHYNLELKEKPDDLVIFDKYTDLSKLAHRQRKRRKRFAFYRLYYQRTHYRAPNIYVMDTREEGASIDFYSKYVEAYKTASYEPVDNWSLREPMPVGAPNSSNAPATDALLPSASFANYEKMFAMASPPS